MRFNELLFPPFLGRKKKPTSPNPVGLGALTAIVFISALASSHAANWYVRPASAGSANGTSWTNAWSIANLNSNWSSVQPGDTVWLAGGTYNTGLTPTVNGKSGSPITVNRVQSTDTAPVASPGWSSTFDSQVIIDSTGPGLSYSTLNVGSWFVFNGRVHNGLRFYENPKSSSNSSGIPLGAIDFGYGSGGQNNISFYNIDIAGPGPVGNENYTQPYFSAPLNVWTWDGNGYGGASNLLLDHCDIHGGVVSISSQNLTNSTIQYCQVYDILDASGVDHSNLVQINASGNITWRYNNVHDWQVEGFFFLGPSPASAPNWWIYGNTFHDCNNSVGRFMESQTGGGTGNVYVWNNTFYNIPNSVFSGASQGTYSSASQCVNNIFWNCAGVFNNWQGSTTNNIYGGGTPSFSGGINGGSTSPFVQVTGDTAANFQLTASTGATTPRATGANLAADFTQDMNGNVFGSANTNGAWDIGAYAYTSGSTGTIPPPQNLTITTSH